MQDADIDFAALAQRSAEMLEQLRDGDWDRLRVDWDDTMRQKLSAEELTDVWQHLLRDAGALQGSASPSSGRTGLTGLPRHH
jgi:hypothetical protein